MKFLTTLSDAPRLIVFCLLWWLPEGLLVSRSPAAEVTIITNQWPSLAEVRQKWAGFNLDGIREAAEKGDQTAAHYLGFCYASGERVQANAELAVSWYQRAGDSGYLPSFNNLGVLYQEGRIVPRDFPKAVGYYRRAASDGMPQAQANLGFAYRDGLGVQVDASEALKWFRLAADQGHTTATVNVGRAYRFGLGVPKDRREAIRSFEIAHERGNPLGTLNLAWMYGYEAPRNEAKAFGLFQNAAEMGQFDAMYELYLAYKNGRGINTNSQLASTWLRKAAEAGHAIAQSLLGRRFAEPPPESGSLRPEPNPPEAVRWYRLSADQDCSRGQYYLGLCYLGGDGVERDEEKGLDLMRRAADHGHNRARYELAGLYARGIGEPRNDADRPLELLKRVIASETRNFDNATWWASDAILFRYQYGIGTERDLIAAAETHCRGADAGYWTYFFEDQLDGRAQPKPENGGSFVGSAERSWISVRKPDFWDMSDEFRQVLSAYQRAAKSNPASLAEIGGRYLTGRGVPRNQTNAWLWLTLALQHGASEVRPTIAQIEGRMTPTGLENVRKSLPQLVQKLSEVSQSLRQISSTPHPRFHD